MGMRDLRRSSKRITFFSWASCATALVVSYFSWLELAAMRHMPSTTAYSYDSDYLPLSTELIAGVAAVLYFVAVIIAAILSLRWIYRANSNAHCLSANMSMSPGWNVGWFFIPIATWWKPFEGIRETWNVTMSPDNPDSVECPAFLTQWWAFWLLTSILGTLSFRVQIRSTTIGGAMAADWLDIASSITLVPATYFFLVVVQKLTAEQYRLLQLSDASSQGDAFQAA